MNEETLGVNDIAPVLGNQLLTILTLEKQVKALQARISELEAEREKMAGFPAQVENGRGTVEVYGEEKANVDA